MEQDELNRWFMDEVLPLEPQLMGYLRRNWRDVDEIDDLRQEVYERVFDAATQGLPQSAAAFVRSVARNLLIDRARRSQVVSIETYADMEAVMPQVDEFSPERHFVARRELRLLQAALEALPARCGEVVRLRKVDGLSQREVAQRLGIAEDTVERQVSKGVRALAAALGREGPSKRRVDDADGADGDDAARAARRH